MSWVDKLEMYSRTSSRNSSVSTDSSSKNEAEQLNLTLYGASVPLRRTRTIIQRTKARTVKTLSLVPGAEGGAAKLLAENTTLDLGFTMPNDEIDSVANPYKQIGDTSSSARTSYCSNRQESDSSDIVDSEKSDYCTSKSIDDSSLESSPCMENIDFNAGVLAQNTHMSRSSTCTSWATDDCSIKSDQGSTSRNIEDYDSNGEWNNFWKKYNTTDNMNLICTKSVSNELCGEVKSNVTSNNTSLFDINKSVPEKKSPQMQRVIMSTADAIEAASCARRLSEILSNAIRRSSLPCTKKDAKDCNLLSYQVRNEKSTIPNPPPLPSTEKIIRSKSDSALPSINITEIELQNKKSSLKPLAEGCVEIEIQPSDPFNIAEILRKVLNQRREVLMPSDDCPSGCQSHRSDWSSFE